MALTKVSTGVVDMSGDTGGLVIAKGNNLERPASPSIGMIRESTETTPSKVEVYTANSGTPGWQFLEEVGPTSIPLTVDYLVVAGGGGGGGSVAGGGGGGGLLTSIGSTSLTLNPGTTYTCTVGIGGSGGPTMTQGTDGSNSSFSGAGITTITSTGGGAGGTSTSAGSNTAGRNGGSGGGGSWYINSSGAGKFGGSGIAGQGFGGGYASGAPSGQSSGGGGGGAGAVGGNGIENIRGGLGGSGLQNSITVASGTGPYYAGGGGGGGGLNTAAGGAGGGGIGQKSTTNGGSGTNGLGGGGGGSFNYSGGSGGNGGDGVIILRYPSIYAITFQTGVGFISSTATLSATSEKVTTITAGSGTITFA